MQPNKWQKREKGNRELFQFLHRICKGKKKKKGTQHHASEPTNPIKKKKKTKKQNFSKSLQLHNLSWYQRH
jgi:hypothetical protein